MAENEYHGKATQLGPGDPVEVPALLGDTFAERAAARKKAVESAENKAVETDETKAPKKRAARKKS